MSNEWIPDVGLEGLSYFMAGTGHPCSLMEICVTLNESLQPEMLHDALKKALTRNWVMRLTYFLDDQGKIHFRENSEEPILFPEDGTKRNLGCQETAGYLFTLSFVNQTLVLRVFHGLTDLHGCIWFLQYILYEYFRSLGKDISQEGIFLACPEDPTERDLSYERMALDADRPETYLSRNPNAFLLPEKPQPEHRGWTFLRCMSADAGSFRAAAKAMSGSVTSLLISALGQAMEETYEMGDRQVVAVCTIDKRHFWNSRSLTNFSGIVMLPRGREHLPLTESCAAQYALLRDRNTKMIHAREAAISVRDDAYYRDIPMKKAAKKLSESWRQSSVTFALSNVGLISFGRELDPLVASVELRAPASENGWGLGLLAWSFGGRLYLSAHHYTENAPWADRLSEILDSAGIDTTWQEQGWVTTECLVYED